MQQVTSPKAEKGFEDVKNRYWEYQIKSAGTNPTALGQTKAQGSLANSSKPKSSSKSPF
jgi:hypothetical protein